MLRSSNYNGRCTWLCVSMGTNEIFPLSEENFPYASAQVFRATHAETQWANPYEGASSVAVLPWV